ncbi:MAG TPA: DUF2062 domain-containing protein [Spirochaetota bacterium]|nr:DUF2062 domain-containing protein [Spirochaetota bacterium]
MSTFIKQKILSPMADLLKQGITPEKLALSVALGFIIGIIPLVGVSTAICAIIALALDLNIAAIQVVNYVDYPLQLLLYIPFIRAGEMILGRSAAGLTISGITHIFDDGFLSALNMIWYTNLQGIIIWVIITIPVTLFLYCLLVPVFRKINRQVPAGE